MSFQWRGLPKSTHQLVDNVKRGAARDMIPRERHFHVKGPVFCYVWWDGISSAMMESDSDLRMLNNLIFNIWVIFSLDPYFLAEARPVGNTFNVQLLPIYLLWR